MYFTGDGCRRDEDGYYWITGRVDDVLNVSGHRMGTAEIESALVAHECVAEAAVVGYPHDIKGQGIYAYVTLMRGVEPTDQLRTDLSNWVRQEIGPIAKPDLIQWAPGLPKTRSGKIMRRILRKIAENDFGALGDISTLADPSVVEDLIQNRMNRDGPSSSWRRESKATPDGAGRTTPAMTGPKGGPDGIDRRRGGNRPHQTNDAGREEGHHGLFRGYHLRVVRLLPLRLARRDHRGAVLHTLPRSDAERLRASRLRRGLHRPPLRRPRLRYAR
jgi:hypothetical protein